MKTLLTFVGQRDPYFTDLLDDGPLHGPILALLELKQFERVILFSRPYRQENVEKTQQAIHTLHSRMKVEVKEMDIRDTTYYPEVLSKMKAALKKILKKAPRDEYFVSTNSGPPEIQACWLLLMASGDFPARLLNFRRSVQAGLARKPSIREIKWDDAMSALTRETLTRLSMQKIAPHGEESIDDGILVGKHPLFRKSLETAEHLSRLDGPILIEGEPGTGKKSLAAVIHQLSERSNQPQVVINCSALPENLAEVSLFGQQGEDDDSFPGKIQSADGGSLVLTHIEELPAPAQLKILRVLDEGIFYPIGSPTPTIINLRLMATTTRKLQDEVLSKRFHEDLYRRFQSGRIELVPLRERAADIPLLALRQLEHINQALPKPRKLSAASIAKLESFHWPGNISELNAVIDQAVMVSDHILLQPEDLDFDQPMAIESEFEFMVPKIKDGFSIETYLTDIRKHIMEIALRKTEGNQSRAARLLGISPQAVSKYLKDHYQDSKDIRW